MEANASGDEGLQPRIRKPEEEEEDEDEEALSLRDLPTNEGAHDRLEQVTKVEHQDDFNFGCVSFSQESKMCAADEVFFQGQILPMFTRSESNQSMDHFTSASSRSSSINSLRSSTSGTSSTSAAAAVRPPRNKLPRRPKSHNQFQFSHPSPKPKPHAHPPGFKNGGHVAGGMNSGRNSTIWSFLRAGLVTTPEIKLRSSSSSRSSCSLGGIKEAADKKPRKNKNRVLFNLSGCKCNVTDAVVGPAPSAPVNAVTRNPTAKEGAEGHADEEADNSVEMRKKCNDEKNGTTRKQSVSRHRTFEWLKQLSLEETAVTVDHRQQSTCD